MKKYYLLAGLAGLCLNSFAQKLIMPGDSHFIISRVKPSHDFYRNIVKDPSGKVLYDFMMENFLFVDTPKKQFIFARYRQVPAGSFSTDTSFTDWSLKPIKMHEIHYQRNIDIQMSFGTELARVTRNAVTKTYTMPQGYFEDNMIEYLFGYFKLEKGITYTLNNFNPATPGNDPYTLKYAFDEANNNVLEFTHGDTRGKIWVDKTTHEVLKQQGNNAKYNYLVTKK